MNGANAGGDYVGGSDDAGRFSESLAAAIYDLGLNYLVRARLLCADAGEGSGLWEESAYQQVPQVSKLAR